MVQLKRTAQHRHAGALWRCAVLGIMSCGVLLLAAGSAGADVRVWRVGDEEHPWNVTPVTGLLDWGRGWATEVLVKEDGEFRRVDAGPELGGVDPDAVTPDRSRWIGPVFMDPETNMSPLLLQRFLSGQFGDGYMIVPTRDGVLRREAAEPFSSTPPNPTRPQVSDPDFRRQMFDGDPHTHYTRDSDDEDAGACVRLMGYYHLSRVAFYPRPAYPDRSPEDYILYYGNHADIAEQTLRAPRVLVPVVEGMPLPVVKEYEFTPPVLTGVVDYRSRHPRGYPWEIAEFEVSCDGFPEDGVYISEIMDVGVSPVAVQRYDRLFERFRPDHRNLVESQFPVGEGDRVTWGRVRWHGERVGYRGNIRIQFRTGNVRDTHVYQRALGGGLFDPQDADGNFLDAFSWMLLSPLERAQMFEMPYNTLGADLGPTGRDGWTAWSAPFRFEDGLVDPTRPLAGQGVQLPLPPRMRYLQFRIWFDSTQHSGVRLDWLEFEYDSAYVDEGIIAEIYPNTAPAGQETVWSYYVSPRFLDSERTFNRLDIDVPADARVEELKVDLPRGGADLIWQDITPAGVDAVEFLRTATPALGEFAQALVENPETGRKHLSLKLPPLGAYEFPQGTEGLIEVVFRSRVYSGSTDFSGRVYDDRMEDTLPQPLEHGEATTMVATRSTIVIAQALDRLTGPVTVAPNPFSPNGDGLNEEVFFSFDLFRVPSDREVLVALDVYDLNGRRLRRVEHRARMSGPRSLSWDGMDFDGNRVPPGIYAYKLVAGQGPSAAEHVGTVAVVY